VLITLRRPPLEDHVANMGDAGAQHQGPADEVDLQLEGQFRAQGFVAHKNAVQDAQDDQLGGHVEAKGEEVDAQHAQAVKCSFCLLLVLKLLYDK
jgi:hypothetical protein